MLYELTANQLAPITALSLSTAYGSDGDWILFENDGNYQNSFYTCNYKCQYLFMLTSKNLDREAKQFLNATWRNSRCSSNEERTKMEKSIQ